MKNAKYTPGPWNIENTGDGELEIWNQNTFIAAVPREHPHEVNITANARLIAASPEMLSALKTVIAAFTGETFGHGLAHLDSKQRMAIGRVINSIAKAEGI